MVTMVAGAVGAVKSVVRAAQAASEVYRAPAAAPALCGKIRSKNCISIGRR